MTRAALDSSLREHREALESDLARARQVPEGLWFATVAELGYGVISWIALAALWKGSRWTRPLMIVWAGLLTVCAAVATVAWGGAGLGAAAVAGASVAAVGALTVWLSGPGRRANENSAAGRS